jgi:hypothetical protein
MRNSSIDSLIIGCGIALGVLAIQALTQGAPAMMQLLALLVVGVVLFCIQLALTLRRARHENPQLEEQDDAPARARPLRNRRRNPFVRELTHDWIGLEDPSPERDTAAPYALDQLDDALWDASPEAATRKPGAEKVDESN